VLISIGTGIGGAVVIDGHLIRGRHNAAGEVAYFPVGPDGAGGRAGFEDAASGTALRSRAAELIAGGQPSSLGAGYSLADVFGAARDGDQVGRQVITELIGHVAAAVAGATALVDPELIILDGSIGRALEPWLAELRAAVTSAVFRAPDIVISTLGPNATVLGATARALAIVAELDGPPARRPRSAG
jgi:glucokinase